jgi:excinuclease UvrABC nuclease subunit
MSEWSERYLYNEANVKRFAPSNGGVYRLINQDGEKYHVFYVGQSDNLERRLLEHLNSSEPNTCIKRHLREYGCYFRFVQVSYQSDRDKIEKEQIEEYRPSCND